MGELILKARIGLALAFLLLSLGVWHLRTRKFPPELRIYTYSSLATSWGAGPELVQAFESRCQCKVDLVDVKDGGVLLQRLLLEREKSEADVILGLDQPRLRYALDHIEFMEFDADWIRITGQSIDPRLQSFWQENQRMIAFDWAPVTFLARSANSTKVFSSLQEYFRNQHSGWALPNPRTSTIGLAFLLWLYSESPKEWAEVLRSASIKTITSGWSQAYGLFQRQQFDQALSYVTSVDYHVRVEKDESIRPIMFAAHPFHVEYAAVPKWCKNCRLAKEFVQFLLEDRAQTILWDKNFMVPVRVPQDLVETVKKLNSAPLISAENWAEALSNQDSLLRAWDELNFQGGN